MGKTKAGGATVAQEVEGGKRHKGSRGVRPSESIQLWSLLKPWPKVTPWGTMWRPELAVVESHGLRV